MKHPYVVQVNEAESQCMSCNWVADVVYVIARSDSLGYQFAKQNGGLCTECFLSKLFEVE